MIGPVLLYFIGQAAFDPILGYATLLAAVCTAGGLIYQASGVRRRRIENKHEAEEKESVDHGALRLEGFTTLIGQLQSEIARLRHQHREDTDGWYEKVRDLQSDILECQRGRADLERKIDQLERRVPERRSTPTRRSGDGDSP